MVHCLNSQTCSLQIIDKKLNALYKYIQTAPAASPVTIPTTHAQEREEVEDDSNRAIKRMASSVEVRAKTNYVECLDAMGFPVTTTATLMAPDIFAEFGKFVAS